MESTGENPGGGGDVRLSLAHLIRIVCGYLIGLDPMLVELVAATYASKFIVGLDPLWVVLVAPSSFGKTELLRPLDAFDDVMFLSSVTPRTFISGARGAGGGNLSLLYEIDGKVMLMKDLTTVLSMRREDRAEVLSQLREIYDGSLSKAFGTGQRVDWRGRVTLLAASTPIVDTYSSVIGVMGHRWLLVRISESDRRSTALRAIESRSDDVRRDGMSAAFKGALGSLKKVSASSFEFPDWAKHQLALLADFASRARTPVDRDRQKRDIVRMPSIEGTPRLAGQLRMVALGRCHADGRTVINDADVRLAQRVAFDTVSPPLRMAILRALLSLESATVSQLAAEVTQVSPTTIRRCLEDLRAVRLVASEMIAESHWWALTALSLEALTGRCER